ncbi:MAG: TonB family protein [Cyclobacteriaceae bacterium]
MNAYLNYLLEASIGLCLFLVVYQLLLRKETNFRFNRMFLLIGLGASIIFPLINIPAANSPVPSLSLSVEPVVTEADLVYSNEVIPQDRWTTWEIATVIYGVGLALFLLVFSIRLFKMLITLRKSSRYNLQNHHIVELKDTSSPFSFFNYIFIGNTPPLTENEKQQIIAHERIHAKLFHSVDIVLLNILGIVFWFNPVIRVYKKIFVQLHEFEADARAVETHDVNEYCSLLARVALHSAEYKLANHFSNSLTVKRIEMMRTIKQKIKNWKMIAVAAFIPMLFFAVSCQDQVETVAVTKQEEPGYPLKVRQAIERLKAKNPNADFIVVPPSGPNLKDFEGKHADHISVIDGEYTFEAVSVLAIKTGEDAKGNAINYLILDYTSEKQTGKQNRLPTEDQWKRASEVWEEKLDNSIDGEPIFFAVEQAASPKEGINEFLRSLKSKIRYPEEAKRLGLKGKVFVKFVVKKDGTATNFEIIKGISKELDLEALRVLKEEVNGWNPGKQNGKIVHSQFVMPVQFGN